MTSTAAARNETLFCFASVSQFALEYMSDLESTEVPIELHRPASEKIFFVSF